MGRATGRVVSVLAAMTSLAGCAAPPADNGPLTPIGDVPQAGAENGPVHDFSHARPGLGGGAEDGPAVPGAPGAGSMSIGGGGGL